MTKRGPRASRGDRHRDKQLQWKVVKTGKGALWKPREVYGNQSSLSEGVDEKRSCLKLKGLHMLLPWRPRNSLRVGEPAAPAVSGKNGKPCRKRRSQRAWNKPDCGKQWAALGWCSAGRRPSHIGVTSGTH